MSNRFSQDQIDSMHADYLYDMVNKTGFGAPKLWNADKPRSFQEYVKAMESLLEPEVS